MSTDVPAENAAGVSPTRAPFRQCAPDHFRVRIHVEYDGTDFAGWQRQTNQGVTSHTTVQGTLEAAVSKIYDKPIKVLGASRTDSGVHANQQVAHFDVPRDPALFDLRYAIQSMTPESIVVNELFQAPPDFHSIACVTDKIYKYRIVNRKMPSALRSRYTYWVRYPLDLAFLNEASQLLLGKQDFKSFQGAGAQVTTTIRTLSEASWAQLEDDTLEFTVRGDGFLKQMIRNLVGTLVDLNQEQQPPERVREILATGDRRRAGPTAPPQGLFLYRVNYPESIDIKCRKL
jgi:tRNA pseudouridine38-40 synthase